MYNHKKDKWINHLHDCQPGSKKLWQTIKNLEAIPPPPPNQSMSFNDKLYDKPRQIANKLNAQYTPAADIKPKQSLRSLCRLLQKPPKDSPSFTFHVGEVSKIIKDAKNSKSTGPDGLSPVMLKHLGPIALNFITDLFNMDYTC